MRATIPGKIVVLGGRTGLLGQALVKKLVETGHAPIALGRADLDVTNSASLERLLGDIFADQGGVLFNTVAYTQVDKAEDEPTAAFAVNRSVPANLARLSRSMGFRLIHYSTDFVFDGKKDTPYTPEDTPNPVSVYGKSKLEGEHAILAAAPAGALIIRVSWLFGPGRMNFVRRILELARDRDVLTVVHDQVGSPGYTEELARGSLALAAKEMEAAGIYHLACSGQASWCELAAEAVQAAGLPCRVHPITTADWPTKAARPAYSVLDTSRFTQATGIIPRPWVQCLRDYIYSAPELTAAADA